MTPARVPVRRRIASVRPSVADDGDAEAVSARAVAVGAGDGCGWGIRVSVYELGEAGFSAVVVVVVVCRHDRLPCKGVWIYRPV